ncbi:DNA-binding transcriptional regulator, LysR family [Pseudooceanicola antarcticus]|uniref:DNA-binding transcriptional regulator, LysR family n=1 Tax=Pseudooceanicola antarcticus TaxID=1247613 RepID=A0A285J5K9_9RHOB|nr:LysR family transcriptional regulator [Pseudooceanicola antarcticus]PJE27099.1 LysR family transcriptional regulator [Pseudooceanicola antarcticus]SNY55564.1 DNA-binding transcriptional regulator, LysR family [Pseudooceanicola antarcticus]
METRQLKTLLAIQSHGTFAQAADVVGLTPSAVSQQVHALEEELRVTIFDRSTRPPRVTPEGHQVLEMARDILRRAEDTKASLSGDQIAGTLMLGSVRSSALNLLPRALIQMRQRYPALKPSLRVSLSTSLIADVAAGRLDAAIVAEHLGFPSALRWSPFLREPLWLIGPPGMQAVDPIELLNTRPYIRFRSAVPLANLIDTELSRLGVVTNDVAEIDTIGSIVTFVRQGLGISVVPHVALQEPEDLGLSRHPFGSPQVNRQIGIVERTSSPRAEIIGLLHGALSELCGEYGVDRDATS